MTKIKLTKEQIDIFEMGTVIHFPDNIQYMYFPFWIKKENGEFELINPEKLPKELKEWLEIKRNF